MNVRFIKTVVRRTEGEKGQHLTKEVYVLIKDI
jgi:hypothetical protein